MNFRFIKSIIFAFCLIQSGQVLAEPPADLAALANMTVICGFNDNVLPEQASTAAQAAIQSVSGKGRHVYKTAFVGFSAYMSSRSAAKLAEHNPNIEFCEQNGLGQAGGKSAQSGGKGGKNDKPKTIEQTTPWGIARVGGSGDGSGLTAWIIDSGIDTDHPDLNVDLTNGKNLVSSGKDTVDDGNGHGTHVAGTLAAIDNKIDVVGVAAGAWVVPVRVLHNSGWATIDDMVAGIDYVAGKAGGSDVANMSIWAYGHYESLHEATKNLANIIPFVIIAGNDYEDINERPSEPSHVVHPNLYVVSAIEEGDAFADFSNYGHPYRWDYDCDGPNKDQYPCGKVNIAAPGDEVLSLTPGGGLATWYGTSMAAPHVAGVLLINNGNYSTDKNATGDPDAELSNEIEGDPIVHR